MIDFAKLQGLTIPEGNVTQITDASGRVLWKKAPSGVTVTIYQKMMMNTTTLAIGDQTYTNAASTETKVVEYVVEVGTSIAITMSCSGLFNGMIKLNGEIVKESSITGMTSTTTLTYNYVVQGNISIELTQEAGSDGKNKGCVSITEL